jgi:integrase
MSREKVSFTERRVATLPAPATAYALFRDADTANLAVRVTAKGARSYVYETRVHGENVRVTIGDVASWKLAAARAEARRLSTVVDRGDDPRVEATAKRAHAEASRIEGQRHGLVLEGVWRVYIEDRKATWGARHLHDHESLAHPGGAKKKRGKGLTKPGPLAALMPLKLSELDSTRIASWLKREAAKRPTNAAQSFRLLRAFVRWTHDVPEYKGIIPLDACTARAVRDVVPESRAKEGDCLQREQLPAWFAAVRSLGNPVISAFLQVLLLTGPRREEAGELRWADIDFAWNGIKLRDKVEEEGRIIPLTPYVASLLNALPRRNHWVFSSLAAEDGRLVEPTKAHNAALKAAGLPHITLHGLRRSFGTLAEWVELPTGVVAQIQGHKPSAIAEKHYRRRPLDLLRSWHTKLEAWILEQAGVAFVPPASAARLAVVNADGSIGTAA